MIKAPRAAAVVAAAFCLCMAVFLLGQDFYLSNPSTTSRSRSLRAGKPDGVAERENGGSAQTKKNVLMLGDSVSRYTVHGACLGAEENLRYWPGDANSLFGSVAWPEGDWVKRSPASVCTLSRQNNEVDKIGHIHLYGSREKGPYFHDACDEKKRDRTGKICHTPERICEAIKEYSSKEGEPSDLVLAIMLWDVSPGFVNNTEDSIAAFRKRVVERLDDAFRCRPGEGTRVHLQTTPSVTKYLKLMQRLNEEIRSIALNRGLCVYDFDRAVWKNRNVDQVPNLFRDTVHPNEEMCAMHAHQILEVTGTSSYC